MKMVSMFQDFLGLVMIVLIVILIFCLLFGLYTLSDVEMVEPFLDLAIIVVLIFCSGGFLIVLFGTLLFAITDSKWLLILFVVVFIGCIYYQKPILEFLTESVQKNFDIYGQKLLDILWIQGLPFSILTKIGILILIPIIFAILAMALGVILSGVDFRDEPLPPPPPSGPELE